MRNLILYLYFLCIPVICFSQKLEDFRFQNITIADGLPSNEVFHCTQDSEGKIWFATSSGIACYNGNYFESFNTSDGLPNNQVFRFHQQKDNIIIGECKNSQYFKIENDLITPLPVNSALGAIIPDYLFSHSYVQLPGGQEMFGSRNGWYIFDSEGELIEADTGSTSFRNDIGYQVFGEYVFTYSFPNYKGNLDYSIGERNGVISIECPYKEGVDYSHSKYGVLIDSGSLAICTGMDVHIITNGELAQTIGTEHLVVGVFYYDSFLWLCTLQNGVVGYKLEGGKYVAQGHFLKDLSVTSILKDNNGVYWITTTNNGVYKMNPNLSAIRLRSKFNNRPSTFFKNRNDAIDGFDYGVIDNKIVRLNNYFQISNIKNLCGKLILHLGQLYELNEINEFKLKKNVFSRERVKITNITELNDSTLICSSYRDIYVYNKEKDVRKRLKCFPRTKVSHLSTLSESVVASAENELLLIDAIADTVINKISAPGNIVAFMRIKNSIAALTENGLFYLIRNNQFYKYSIPEIDDVFAYYNGVLSNNTLILSTNTGIYFWGIQDLDNFQLTHFEPHYEANYMTVYADTFFFVSNQGLFCKPIGDYKLVLPQLWLKSIVVGSEKLENGTDIKLEYDQNELRFEFDGVSTEMPILNYRYELIGVDKNCRISKDNKVIYSSVQPGEYMFSYAATSDGFNYSEPKQIRIFIDNPYWKKAWFVILMVILIVAIATAFIYRRIRKVKKRALAQNRLTELKAQALSAQLNPHLVFNVLNSIQGLVAQSEIDKALLYISRFAKFMRGSLKMSKKVKVRFDDDLEITKKYIELEKLRFGNAISFSFKIEPNCQEIQVPPLILQPFIENAIKHGLMPSNNLEKKLIISARIDNEKMLITVEDNGAGFSGNLLDRVGDGLRISMERLASIDPRNNVRIKNNINPTIFLITIYIND
ncbi:MAG: histidine kinase [Flavobacteriales bacterium]|nr:histidine kinase [Flavobacteriales bacterium]